MRQAQFSPYPLSPIPFKDFLSQAPYTGFRFLDKKYYSDGKCTSVSTLLKHISDTITTRSHYLHILKSPEKILILLQKNFNCAAKSSLHNTAENKFDHPDT